MRRAWKIFAVLVGVAAVIVIAITAWGMYLNAQDERTCADLYPTDWNSYEACRAIVQRLQARRRIMM